MHNPIKLIILVLFLFACFTCMLELQTQSASPLTTPDLRQMPILYQGRFRPMEAYSRLWLEERYGNPSIRRKDLPAFPDSNGSALDVLWRWILHPQALAQAPLFLIPPAVHKSLGNIENNTHFSFKHIEEMLQGHHPYSRLVWDSLLAYHAKAIKNYFEPVELRLLAKGLVIEHKKDSIKVLEVPEKGFGKHLSRGYELTLDTIDPLETEGWMQLLKLFSEPKEWMFIPPKSPKGNWLKVSQAPEEIQQAFQRAQRAMQQHDTHALVQAMKQFSLLLQARYEPLAQEAALSAPSVTLYYPTWSKLWTESIYVRLPCIPILLVCYACGTAALVGFALLNHRLFRVMGLFSLGSGWLLHTLLLVMRVYILGRPPVSNMFETVLYVPWICMLIGWIAQIMYRGYKTLLAASLSSLLLLSFIPLTGMRGGMENVQAVLDSRYWLIVHVLMVVGSYGAFFVSGLLAHGFLIGMLLKKISPANQQSLQRAILLTLYVGVCLLIPGTLLGGVWAAQSWGRFWDWDPKESWACITSCIYLYVIHLYRFGRIQSLGLALGSIIGLAAVSFTWYGVNYLLGVGLHSYGFGAGGEGAYISYLLAESAFLILCLVRLKSLEEERGQKKPALSSPPRARLAKMIRNTYNFFLNCRTSR